MTLDSEGFIADGSEREFDAVIWATGYRPDHGWLQVPVTVLTAVTDAGGLRRGDPVQMRGVNIGRVVGFDMAPNGVEIRLEFHAAS